MRYHNITKDDMLNGEGLRAVLWVSGCNHYCKGCHNPVTWELSGGLPFDEGAKEELFDCLGKPYISGLTLSGGDPLHPENRADVEALLREVVELFPHKSVWLYTGYLWESVMRLPLMRYVDVVVDGEYIEGLKDPKLHWRGSSNQRIIDVPRSLLLGEAAQVPLEGEETADAPGQESSGGLQSTG
ncbi:MAG: anaerobic ribonucleoside-triphosphate reductase activating protein [Lachnospiraceae bacterium]|nr:anaerobic ribonucleoside-triphosphate reductase activating protein [Lachnospiraceae bacterium]